MGGPGSGRKKKKVGSGEEDLSIEEGLKILEQVKEAIEGKKDIKYRVKVMADPDNPKTMSVLTPSKADFCENSTWIAERPIWGSMFKGVKDLANEELQFNISVGGRGRDDTIRFTGAMSESAILKKMGITVEKAGAGSSGGEAKT